MMKMRAVYGLVLLNVVLFAAGASTPLHIDAHPLSVLGYAFSHATWAHLLLNMLALLSFGLGIERKLGSMEMVAIFVVSALCGAMLHMMVGDTSRPMLGASAGVMGVITVYAMLFPNNRVMLLMFPMRAITMLAIITVAEVVFGLAGWLPNVAHWAHVGGALAGLLLGLSRK